MADTVVQSAVDVLFTSSSSELVVEAGIEVDEIGVISESSSGVSLASDAPQAITTDASDVEPTHDSTIVSIESDGVHGDVVLAETAETEKTESSEDHTPASTTTNAQGSTIEGLPLPIAVGLPTELEDTDAEANETKDEFPVSETPLPPPEHSGDSTAELEVTSTPSNDFETACEGHIPTVAENVAELAQDADPDAVPSPSEGQAHENVDVAVDSEAVVVVEEPVEPVNLMDSLSAPSAPKLTHLTANRARGPGGGRRPPTRGVVVESKPQSVPDIPMDVSQVADLTMENSLSSTSDEITASVSSPGIRKAKHVSLGMPMMQVDFSAVKLKPSASKESVEAKTAPKAAEAPTPSVSADLKGHLRSRSASGTDVRKNLIDKSGPPAALPPPIPAGMPSSLETSSSDTAIPTTPESKSKKKIIKIEKSASAKDVERSKKKEAKDAAKKDAAKKEEKEHKEKELKEAKETKDSKSSKETKEAKESKKKNRLSSQPAAASVTPGALPPPLTDIPPPLPAGSSSPSSSSSSALPAPVAAPPAVVQKKSAIANLLTSFFKSRPKREALVEKGLLSADDLPPPISASSAVGSAVSGGSSSKKSSSSAASSSSSAPLPPPVSQSSIPAPIPASELVAELPQSPSTPKGAKQKKLTLNKKGSAASLPPPVAVAAPPTAPPPPAFSAPPAPPPPPAPPAPKAKGAPGLPPPLPSSGTPKSKAPSALPPPMPSSAPPGPPSGPPPMAPPATPASGPPSALPPPLPTSPPPPSKSKK